MKPSRLNFQKLYGDQAYFLSHLIVVLNGKHKPVRAGPALDAPPLPPPQTSPQCLVSARQTCDYIYFTGLGGLIVTLLPAGVISLGFLTVLFPLPGVGVVGTYRIGVERDQSFRMSFGLPGLTRALQLFYL